MENCDKYEFNYWNHIKVKQMISPEYRWFTEVYGLFQALNLNKCSHCMVEGTENFSLPFYLSELHPDELRCTLHRMGLKYAEYRDVELMPELEEYEEELYCEHCLEIAEEEFNN